MKLTLAYSTCPNDTFIFDALAHGKIDTEGIDFEISLADIDVLNKNAVSANPPDITKISSNAYGIDIWKDYVILDSGSALGRNNGPLLVAKNEFPLEEMDSKRILIPGVNTTANLLFTTFFPNAKDKTPLLFSKIEGEVISGHYDAGLLIHEGRFTYKSKGLVKIADMGELWEQRFGMPIPLGSIIAKRNAHSARFDNSQTLIASGCYSQSRPHYPPQCGVFVCPSRIANALHPRQRPRNGRRGNAQPHCPLCQQLFGFARHRRTQRHHIPLSKSL